MEATENSQTTPEKSYRLTVTSIGNATALATKVIASGLNLAPEKVAEKLYRAPSILADNLTEDICQQLATLIQDLGIEVRVESSETPPPPPSELYDISVQISEIEHLPSVVEKLSPFLGINETQIISLLITPPAIILGSVSLATLSALKRLLTLEGVNIIASRPTTANYDLISSVLNSYQTQQLNQFLQRLNLSLQANNGLCLSSLDYRTAQTIWKHFGHNLPIKIINQDFYRYDILINNLPDIIEVAAQQYLENTIGISPADYPSVQAHLPLVIHESISHQEALKLETECATHGLLVSKINITFQRLKIQIHTVEDLSPVDTLLQQLGLIDTPLKKLPYITRDTSETFARFAKHLLERNGAQVSYQECAV
ncbi:hypothetical protein [Nitrincola schmidtii]|uniref:hypothetical protein n=1 Tax=Nitrincola schmidtii TaxID=1730894 RepID=UPI00124BE5C4|nr:hypothetical protein [Nitrincola schmidtii]